MSNDIDATKFVELLADHDYEISTTYPFIIRRKSDGFIPSESINGRGYVQIILNKKNYLKHRLIAQQFIPNDDPVNKDQVDHINHDRTDYHIENMRWCTHSMNCFNKSGKGDIRYEYVDRLPIDVTPIILYRGWEFEGYFIDHEHNIWFDNGEQYRKLHVSCKNQISMWDINHVRRYIGVRALVREFL